MGLVLEEDERGNVYIVEIVPGGNASRKKTINVSQASLSGRISLVSFYVSFDAFAVMRVVLKLYPVIGMATPRRGADKFMQQLKMDWSIQFG